MTSDFWVRNIVRLKSHVRTSHLPYLWVKATLPGVPAKLEPILKLGRV